MVSSAQLSLFDTSTVIQPACKVGDRVKVRKKPIGASYIKKGDVVEIEAIHPINGSIKFWNERSERWEFIQRDEICSIIPNDSPTAVEVAVGESICPDDSPTVVEVAVGESICPDDSPTVVEVAVGESIVPDDSPTVVEVAVGESIVPDDSPTVVEVAVGESICPDASPTVVEVAVGESIVPNDIALNSISTYRPRGTARGGKYYRLSYKDGGKVRQVHIRGGNTDSPIAQAKVREVRSLLAAGVKPAEIAAMLKVK
jgi:hypothetical protein